MNIVNTRELAVNVLSEFLVKWIKANTEEGAKPFDSFEVMICGPTRQKDVERWIFNINYLYYCVGNRLYSKGYLGKTPDDGRLSLGDLRSAFLAVSDSNPMNLRAKSDEAILKEMYKDWPPFVSGSRNKVGGYKKGLESLRDSGNSSWLDRPDVSLEIRGIGADLEEQANLFFTLKTEVEKGDMTHIECCKSLLPLWCVTDANPLYSLLIWNDEDAIAELASRLAQLFEKSGYPSANGGYSHSTYVGAVRRSQRLYLDSLGASEDGCLDGLPLSRIHQTLERNFFSLEKPCSCREVPAWLYGKAQLIWNVVACSIFGPKEVIIGSESLRTGTCSRGLGGKCARDGELSGQILLRRQFASGASELVDTLRLGDIDGNAVWHVFGRSFDRDATIPSSLGLDDEELMNVFVGTEELDSDGCVVEGHGDSRFHLALFVEVSPDGEKSLICRDLGSKNGSYVQRGKGPDRQVFLLKGRRFSGRERWARDHGFDSDAVNEAERVRLRRGDLICLCDSCFEIL